MPLSWRDAVVQALIRQATVHQSSSIHRRELIVEQLERIVTDTQSDGSTPEQTLSRVLQELRDSGEINFLDHGRYDVTAIMSRATQMPTPNYGDIGFGEIPGYPPGSVFASRRELHSSGLHRHTMAGISGSESDGADAIVLSGGYQDDEDYGDLIIYTGQGGNSSGRQVADQTLTRGNLGLAVSQRKGLPASFGPQSFPGHRWIIVNRSREPHLPCPTRRRRCHRG